MNDYICMKPGVAVDLSKVGKSVVAISRDLSYVKVYHDQDMWEVSALIESMGGKVMSRMFEQEPCIAETEDERYPSLVAVVAGTNLDALIPIKPRWYKHLGRKICVLVMFAAASYGTARLSDELAFRKECREIHRQWDNGGITQEAWLNGTARIWNKYGK